MKHPVILYHIITVYSDTFGHIDGVMRSLANKKTPWNEHLYFAMKLVPQKLSKDYTEVTPMKRILLTSAHIIDSFCKLWSFWNWQNGMDINPEDKASYTPQYQEPFLNYVES